MIGIGIACQLRQSPILHDKFIILEKAPFLAQNFFDAVMVMGQKVMRSPYQHQLASDGTLQLLDFARLHHHLLTPSERNQVRIALTGQRAIVPVDVFIAHTTHTIGSHCLQEVAYRWEVQKIVPDDEQGDYIIQSKQGQSIRSKYILLAAGNRPYPFNKVIAKAQADYPRQIQSAYEKHAPFMPDERVVILGSGLSAGHVLMQILHAGGLPIWIVRKEERYQCADFDTAYFRTEGVSSFRRLTIPERMNVLAEVTRGSLMLEFLPLIHELESAKRLQVHRWTKVDRISGNTDRLCVHLSNKEKVLADRIVIATGYTPDTRLIPDSVKLFDGKYPFIDDNTLEVGGFKNLFAVGSLASLALGPAARNIDGARLASEKLIPVLEQRLGGLTKSVRLRSRIIGTNSIRFPSVQRGFI